MQRRVEFADTDMAGIVHFAMFFRYMETAEHEMFRSIDLPITSQHATRKLGWPRVSCGFDFEGPLRFGDVFEVHIRVARIGDSSISFAADIVRDGESLARGRSTSVCCNLENGVPTTSVTIPPDIVEKLKRYLSPGTPHEEATPGQAREE